jgi:hypothetical protein
LLAASNAAAETEASLSSADGLAQTIRRLQSASAKLTGTSNASSSLKLLQMAAQEARWLTGDARLAQLARDVARGATENSSPAGAPNGAALKALADQARNLAKALERAAPGAQRDEWVHRFSPEEIAPNYRKPVEDYFETLSREGAAR